MAAIFPSGVTSATDDASNTSFPTSAGGSISIAEGCSPANVNDALRAIATMLAASWGGMYSGTSRPAAVQSGSFWINTSGGVTDYALTYYDGTDDIEVLSINTTANSVAFTADLTGDVTGNVTGDVTGDLTGNANITDAVTHSGDTDNKIAFGTDTQDMQTGGSSRLDISDSGVRFGGANARVTTILDEDAMGSDSATALATQQSIKAYVDAQSGGALTLGSLQATTSGTAIDWTSIPAGTQQVHIFLAACELGAGKILVQIGDSGGVETTGYTSAAAAMGVGRTNSSTGFVCEHVGNNGEQSGWIVLTLVDATNFGWGCSSNLVTTVSGTYSTQGAGYKDLSAELDRVRLTTTTGSTFTAGEAVLYYM